MKIKTSPRHRKCKYPLCKNILSIYNHEIYCYAHLKAISWGTLNFTPTGKGGKRAVGVR